MGVVVWSGFSAEEIREFVLEYETLPYGMKSAWLAARGVPHMRLRRWRAAVFEGDLDRGLIPREGIPMTIPTGERRAIARRRAQEQAAHEVEVARLEARVQELEATNALLGKAIGLLHQMNEQEPDANPTRSDRSNS